MISSSAAALEPPPDPAPLPVPETLPSGDPNLQSYAPVVDILPDAGMVLGERNAKPEALPAHVTKHLISGTSAYGASVAMERGAGFLANILAARLGGAPTFGAYSLAINTATNISTYAAGGIGATAARFSGKYPQGSAGYPSLMRALAIVSLVSATVAAAGLWLGAGPIAHLLGKESFVTLLRCAWISAAGVVLLECARGFFVGQRFVAALLSMSLTVGAGMVFLLPYAAHRHSPKTMIELQGGIALCAVGLCCLLGKQFGWMRDGTDGPTLPLSQVLREVWSFGLVQLTGLIGTSLAGYWTTALVARGDRTLVQVSFFTIASQMRNLVSLPPSLLTEGSYAVMADPTHEASQTPQRVMALCTFAALSVSVLLGALGIVLVPWGLTLLYGKTYGAAGAAVAVALATAVAHMGTAPAAARLSIVSIRATAMINTIWAVFVAIAATVFMMGGGAAWKAMAIFFCAHILASAMALGILKQRDYLPEGLIPLSGFSFVMVAVLATLSLWRGVHGHNGAVTGVMLLLLAVLVAGLYQFGKRYSWLPPRSVFIAVMGKLPGPLGRLVRHV